MSRFEAQTVAPTKVNLIEALGTLTSPVWQEALLPHDDREIKYLFDVEINALINVIAARSDDLTIVFDCC